MTTVIYAMAIYGDLKAFGLQLVVPKGLVLVLKCTKKLTVDNVWTAA